MLSKIFIVFFSNSAFILAYANQHNFIISKQHCKKKKNIKP